MPNARQIMHIKIPKGSLSNDEVLNRLQAYDLNCSVAKVAIKSRDVKAEKGNKNRQMDYLIGFMSSFVIIEATCIGLARWSMNSWVTWKVPQSPSHILNPPFSLTNSDRYRLRTYIGILNNRQGYAFSEGCGKFVELV
ncbi:hypothetical protein D8674_024250 [Pyrus ussuriensis x Pyrus communis]|uniref:Uncharacterized protein n=1 Tax=Pyrus ussuriensis x Pyrus communis TaxID=2448454 RepID=A0A5N5H395_9ROSA|nr:hypothetical protein D8674_024250 [Pyrus ussuriensis x Pyrus communis]